MRKCSKRKPGSREAVEEGLEEAVSGTKPEAFGRAIVSTGGLVLSLFCRREPSRFPALPHGLLCSAPGYESGLPAPAEPPEIEMIIGAWFWRGLRTAPLFRPKVSSFAVLSLFCSLESSRIPALPHGLLCSAPGYESGLPALF